MQIIEITEPVNELMQATEIIQLQEPINEIMQIIEITEPVKE